MKFEYRTFRDATRPVGAQIWRWEVKWSNPDIGPLILGKDSGYEDNEEHAIKAARRYISDKTTQFEAEWTEYEPG